MRPLILLSLGCFFFCVLLFSSFKDEIMFIFSFTQCSKKRFLFSALKDTFSILISSVHSTSVFILSSPDSHFHRLLLSSHVLFHFIKESREGGGVWAILIASEGKILLTMKKYKQYFIWDELPKN